MTRCPASWALVRPAASPALVSRAGATAARALATEPDTPPASAIPKPASACRRLNPLRGRSAEAAIGIDVSLPGPRQDAEHNSDSLATLSQFPVGRKNVLPVRPDLRERACRQATRTPGPHGRDGSHDHSDSPLRHSQAG